MKLNSFVPFLRQQRELRSLSNHRAAAFSGDHSFANEAPHLLALCNALGIEAGYVVDMAASDGVSQSCLLPFFRDPKWAGLAVEMDAQRFKLLCYAYTAFDNVALAKSRVTPENVAHLLLGYEVPTDFDVLNLDIDSYDLSVIEQILKSGFRPKIISMEINEKIPPPLFFAVKYDPDWYWKGDHFYGCSATAAADTVEPFGYIIESIQYNNIFFIDAGLARGRFESVRVEKAYREGYADREDRARLFPYNADVDAALTMAPEAACEFFAGYFSQYSGHFDLR